MEEELKEEWRKLRNKQLTVCATNELLLGQLSYEARGFKCGWGNNNIMLDFGEKHQGKIANWRICACMGG